MFGLFIEKMTIIQLTMNLTVGFKQTTEKLVNNFKKDSHMEVKFSCIFKLFYIGN